MSPKKTVLSVIGTRPELIKMAPVVDVFRSSKDFQMKVCFSGQHTDLIESVQKTFDVPSDFRLGLMTENQTLWDFSGKLLSQLGKLLQEVRPVGVFAQGDTATVLISALASFYSRIPFFHVEAGMRTFDLDNPFPEEAHRVLAGKLASLHFAPTALARGHLVREGVPEKAIHVTGNTVVDALLRIKRLLPPGGDEGFGSTGTTQLRRILVTMHRRENFGEPFRSVLQALKQITLKRDDVEILFPVHPNPNVRQIVHEELANIPQIKLVEPLGYLELLSELQRSYLVVTDSGGIQEEAPSFGKPVLILRKVTERMEAVHAGVARLVGTNGPLIVQTVHELLDDSESYQRMVPGESPFGDGRAAERILEATREFYC
jgi:UDP-N-acetylglucosamine 2-epimerase (non-hydrolysing)